MTILQTVIYHPTKAQRKAHESRGKGGMGTPPCGNGNQPACIPLTDHLWILIVIGGILAIKKLLK